MPLIQDGILKNFLMSRMPITNFSKSNGHGRHQAGFMPTGRQGNLIVQSTKTVKDSEMRAQLIDEVKKEGKPYGLYFEDVQGGFTLTTRELPQAFQVLPVIVWRVYPDGRPDQLVRGVDIVGTPLASLNRILLTGDKTEVFNGICGAESGSVPVSASAPAMLFSEMEVQKRSASRERPPILPPPGFEELSRRRCAGRAGGRCAMRIFPAQTPHGDWPQSFLRLSGGVADCSRRASQAASCRGRSDPILRALQEELTRSKAQLKMDNVESPFYIEYRIFDVEQFEASAAFGALRDQNRTRLRVLRAVVRLGDYKLDSFFNAGQGVSDILPLDNDELAIRHAVWLATDQAYKRASEAFSNKKAQLKQLNIDQPVDDFAKADSGRFYRADGEIGSGPGQVDENAGVRYRGVHATIRRFKRSLASVNFTVISQYFVNTEGTVTRHGSAHYQILLSASEQAPDGMRLERSPQFTANRIDGTSHAG